MNNMIPISFKELTNLQAIGINPNLCRVGVLSFESDKYISTRDVQPNGDANLQICELEKNFQLTIICLDFISLIFLVSLIN